MSRHWPKVRLGEVLRRSDEMAELHADTEYSEITVRLWGKGVIERGRLLGAEIAGNKRFVAREGQFIASRIDARNGAMGIVPAHLDGAVVTNDFPLFNIDAGRLLPAYFRWLSGTQGFVELCLLASEGTTNRVRLKEDRFLALEIPLPPLAEQRRIVARIEELAAQIHEARALRRQAAEDASTLTNSGRNAIFGDAVRRFRLQALGDVSSRITKGESPEWQGFAYQDTGPVFVRSENVLWGQIDYRAAVHIPSDFHEKLRRSQLTVGDVLINLVGASIGRACVVPEGLGSANVNQAVAVISPVRDALVSEFLMQFLLSPIAQDTIHGGKVETARPNISLNDLRKLQIPVPPLSEQRRIVAELDALQAEVDALKRHQTDTAAEIDALLPAILDRAFRGEL